MQKKVKLVLCSLLLTLSLTLSGWCGVKFSTDDGDYITFGDVAAVDASTKLSISIWVNNATVSDDDYVVANNDAFNGGGFIFFRDNTSGVSGNTNVWRLTVYDNNDSSTVDLESNVITANSTDTRVHLAISIDLDGDEMSLYVDGSEVANSPVSIASIASIDSNAAPLAIGTLVHSTSGRGFDGKENECYVWDGYILTQSDVDLLFNSKIKGIGHQISPSNLIIFTPLDDYADGTALNTDADGYKDRSGNGNHGQGVDADGDSLNIAEEILSYP